MASFCSIADLSLEAKQAQIATLAMDADTGSADISDADVTARLTRYITEESNRIRNRLLGRVDVDSVTPGSQLADDLRRWATVCVLERLHRRRHRFSEQTNPFMAEKKSVMEEIRAVAEGTDRIGSGSGSPAVLAWSSTADDSPLYGEAAEGGSGTDGTGLGGF